MSLDNHTFWVKFFLVGPQLYHHTRDHSIESGWTKNGMLFVPTTAAGRQACLFSFWASCLEVAYQIERESHFFLRASHGPWELAIQLYPSSVKYVGFTRKSPGIQIIWSSLGIIVRIKSENSYSSSNKRLFLESKVAFHSAQLDECTYISSKKVKFLPI